MGRGAGIAGCKRTPIDRPAIGRRSLACVERCRAAGVRRPDRSRPRIRRRDACRARFGHGRDCRACVGCLDIARRRIAPLDSRLFPMTSMPIRIVGVPLRARGLDGAGLAPTCASSPIRPRADAAAWKRQESRRKKVQTQSHMLQTFHRIPPSKTIRSSLGAMCAARRPVVLTVNAIAISALNELAGAAVERLPIPRRSVPAEILGRDLLGHPFVTDTRGGAATATRRPVYTAQLLRSVHRKRDSDVSVGRSARHAWRARVLANTPAIFSRGLRRRQSS
jgi:hypothetical protein